jgi:hypothetical protein
VSGDPLGLDGFDDFDRLNPAPLRYSTYSTGALPT